SSSCARCGHSRPGRSASGSATTTRPSRSSTATRPPTCSRRPIATGSRPTPGGTRSSAACRTRGSSSGVRPRRPGGGSPRARATLFARVATQLRRVYAAGLPAARRERLRSWLAAAAAETLVRRGLGRREELVPPNNARLLGELVYGTDLDVFDRLAERDADLGPALRALVR